MAVIPSTSSLTLDLPPSCIAFSPSTPHFFVIGSYFLHPKEQQTTGPDTAGTVAAEGDENDRPIDGSIEQEDQGSERLGKQLRTGSLILFRLDVGSDVITQVVTVPTPHAILDVQWTPNPSVLGDLLAVATSTGQLEFYRLDASGDGDLVYLSTKAVSDPSTLVLSLAWRPSRSNLIGFTLSDGSVCLCESTEGGVWSQDAVTFKTTIQQHTLEAWTLAFVGESPTNVLSGGDDCVLQYSTIIDFDEHEGHWQDRKLHGAGVTAIMPLTSSLVVTGSYDDHIRLISFSRTSRRLCLAEANLGGGVWRLKTLSMNTLPVQEGIEPEISSLVILASCMHAGARVVQLCKGEDGWKFEVLAKFEEHQSMNYGADFQLSEGAGKKIVSISFYDKLMCLWKIENV